MNWNNKWHLTGIFIGSQICMGIVLAIILSLVGYTPPSTAVIPLIGASYLTGYLYAKNKNKLPPKELRKEVTILYIIFSIVLTIVIVIPLMWTQHTMLMLLIIIIGTSIIVAAPSGLAVYFCINSGAKTYLKSKKK